MDDDMDDFGDLYGDLEDRVNAGTSCVQENQYSFSVERNMSSSKSGEFDSIYEEHSSDDRIGEGNERPVASNGGNQNLVFGVEESGNSSDSEDDLHIVLNEEDCLKLPPSQRVNPGSGNLPVGEGEREEDDADLAILYGSDCLKKSQKRGDQLPSLTDATVQGSTERGNAAKSSNHGWYVGSNHGGFLYSGKTLMSGRSDRDQLMMVSSGGTASCDLSIRASAQNGFSFTLPRNRTIFDISIESFEQKPWRQPGVDITDYFNFGLDEDSWKSYCQHLDQFRQKAAMFTQFPDYNLSRLNQGSPKAMLDEAAQWGHTEKCFLDMENVDRRLMGLQLPKGKAIQVESGVSERIPSIDIRRPRHRDSDVVIQIAMDDSMEDVSILSVGELEHAEQGHVDCSMLACQNEPNDGMLSRDHDDQSSREITDPLVCGYPEVAETNLKGVAEEDKAKLDSSRGYREDSLRVDASLMEAECASDFQLMCSFSSSDLDSHSEASKDVGGLKKIHGATKKASVSATELQESVRSDRYLSNDYRISVTKAEPEDIKGDTYDCHLSPEGQKGCSRSGHRIMAELNIPAEDEQASIQSSRKCQNDVEPFEVSYRTRERNADIGGRLSCNQKTKISYKSRKYAEKHVTEKSSTKASHKKRDHDIHPWRNRDMRDSLLEQGASGRDHAIKHQGCYLLRWHHDDRGERVINSEDLDKSIPKCGSFSLGKDSSMWHKKERENEHIIQTDSVNYDSIFERSYREKHVHEMHRRYIPESNRKEGIFDHRFRRPAPCGGREQRTPERRINYDQSSCFDLYGSNKYIEYDAERLRHLDGKLLDSPNYEYHVEDERGWCDASPLENRLPRLWRSHEKFVDHRKQFAIREIQSRYKKFEYCIVPSSKDYHHPSYEHGSRFDDDEDINEEGGTYVDGIVLEKRYGCFAKQRLDVDDKVSFRHRDPDFCSRKDTFLCEGSARHEKTLVNQNLFCGRKFSDDRQLGNAGKEVINEKSAASDARGHNKFVLHNFDTQRHELATLGCRDTVNMHLNGLKRKFHKRGNEVTLASERHREGADTMNKELKSSKHIDKARILEVPPHVSKSEGTHDHQTSLKERERKLNLEEYSDDCLIKCKDKHPISQNHDDDEIEEGQLIEESDDQHVGLTAENWNSEKNVASPAVKASRSAHLEESNGQTKEPTSDNDIFVGYDSNRILETLAKMEKRRERFKEPIALKGGPEKTLKPQLDVAAVTDEVKQQRPARKRRWGSIQ